MTAKEPSWWYRPRRSWQALALSPISMLYGALARRRIQKPSAYEAQCPVICVGNFTAGGTGKTPLSIALAEMVRACGREPVFLTRGYGGSAHGPLIVDAHTSNTDLVGDEPLLLARVAPTVVSRRRDVGARYIEQSFSPEAVIIMDDGLQNPTLAKTLSIAIVDARRRFGNAMCLPSGPLRAPLAAQVSKVNVVVMSGEASPPELQDATRQLRGVFTGLILRAHIEGTTDVKWLNGARVVAFAGIANPDRFFDLVTKAGAQIVARSVYPDHHAFTEADADALLALADAHHARLITTEKDFVRLYGAQGRRGALREMALTVPIVMRLADDDHDKLAAILAETLAKRPNHRAVREP